MKLINKFSKTCFIFFVAAIFLFLVGCESTLNNQQLETPNVTITNGDEGFFVFVANDDNADLYTIRVYDEDKEQILNTFKPTKEEVLIGFKIIKSPGTYNVCVMASDKEKEYADSEYTSYIEVTIESKEPIKKTYKITYVLNGGVLPIGAKDEYSEGEKYVLPTPTKENAEFVGWYTNSSFTGNKITSTSSGDLVVYASFKEESVVTSYKINYVLNGGTNPSDAQNTYTEGETVILKNPTKTNAKFMGWYLNSNFSGEKVSVISNTTKGDVTLYAKWEEESISYTGYYEDASGLTGEALKKALRTIISTGLKTVTYDNLKNYLPYTDADPNDSSKIMLFYSQISVSNKWDPNNSWNREHVWPKSLGWYNESGAGSDIHHLRPENNRVNSTRGNMPFAEVTGGKNLTYSNKVVGVYGGGKFEPLDEVKGDVARIIMYMLVRYSETDSSYTYKKIITSLELLLEWHELDPVSEFEIVRNQRSYEKQGNYNPFIDHPEFALMIWG